MKLVIGNKNYSSWSLRAWILLTHFKLPFNEIRIPLFTDKTLEQMLDYCPAQRVPALIDENTQVWDSLAICEYINEQYLTGTGWPKEAVRRAYARSICAEMHAGFYAMREEMPMNCRRRPAKIQLSTNAENDIARIIAIWSDCLHQSTGPYLFDEFSIADAYFLPVVIRFSIYQIEVPHRIMNYMSAMMALESYQQWLNAAIDEKEVIACEEV